MNFKIESENIEIIPNDDVCYISSDYSLSIDLKGQNQVGTTLQEKIHSATGVRSNSFLLKIDTLTITFAGPNYRLRSIDAYTNENVWKHTELLIPTVCSSASLFLTGEFTDDL